MGSTATRDTEVRLMSAFEHGDAVAARELYRRFGPRVFGIGLRTLRDAARAEALVQDAFVRLWRRAPRFGEASVSLEDWVVAHALGIAMEMSHRPEIATEEANDVSTIRL